MQKQVWLRVLAGVSLVMGIGLSLTAAHAQTGSAGSLQFDGVNDSVRTANLPPLAAFTVEAWVKRTADSGTYETILSDASSSYSQAMLTVFVDGGSRDCGGDQFAYFQLEVNSVQCSGVVADLGVWHHLAVTRDASGTRRFFVDGVLRSTQANIAAPSDSSGAFTLGRAGDSSTEYFPGLIDEVRVSSAAMYTANFTAPTSPLPVTAETVGLWSLDEGVGQIVTDRSGNGRHGTLGAGTSAESGDPVRTADSPLDAGTPIPATPSGTPSTTPPPSATLSPITTASPSATAAPTHTQPAAPSSFGSSLRFYGHGVSAPDLDRVKIQIDDPSTAGPGSPADIGATDFTLEFWMKARATDNPAGAVTCGANINWIYGNILLDRDRYMQDRKFGLSLAGGRVVFGVSGDGSGDTTVCSTTNVLDSQWHHIAVQRRRADGWLWLYVDGVLNAQANGPDGDVSYPDNGTPGLYCGGPCDYSDPYLVLGAEKHDAGAAYPSYSGWLDELRLSTTLRYGNVFSRPQAPFATDGYTAALYHFNELTSGPCTGLVVDSSGAAGGPSNGQCHYGGSGTAGPQYSSDVPGGFVAPTATPSVPQPTHTPAPTHTPTSVAEAIFADGFEGGSLAAWSAGTIDGGDLSVSDAAALEGGHGLQAVIDDNTAIYLTDHSPTAEARYRAHFLFDPNSIGMGNGDWHTIFRGDAASGATAVRIEFRYFSGTYQVRAGARTDGGTWLSTAWATLADSVHSLEVDWQAAGVNAHNGALTFRVDGGQHGALTGLDNDTRRVDRALLGAVSGLDSRTRGVYFFDDFESRRATYLGP
jgi:hypothetical protein